MFKLKSFNFEDSKLVIGENYVPLTSYLGKEEQYFNLYHYRLSSKNNVVEFHFNKSNGELKRFNIINLDKTDICKKEETDPLPIFDNLHYTLQCEPVMWGNIDEPSNFISDNSVLNITYNDNQILIRKEGKKKESTHFKKLTENLAINLNEEGNISAILLFNLEEKSVKEILNIES